MKFLVCWSIGLLISIGSAAATELSAELGKLEKEERYNEMVRLFEGRKIPPADLAGEELVLVISGYFGVNDYEKIMGLSELVFSKCPGEELTARICMTAARNVNRDKEGLSFGLKWIEGTLTGRAIYKDIAIACCDVGDYAAAVKYGKIACKRAPNDQRAKGIYVYALAQVEGVDAAFTYYGEVKSRTPDPEIYFLVQFAKGIYDENAYDRVLPVLDEILAKDPSEVSASRMKIHSLKKTDKMKEARKFAEMWIAQYKPDSFWCNEYGTVLFQNEDYVRAREYFEKAVHWDEWYSTAVENLLVTLNELNEYGAAIQYAAKWKHRHESAWTRKMNTQIGNSYSWMLLYDLAEIYYRRALVGHPDTFAQVRDVMYAVRKQGRAEEAIAMGEAWLARNPGDAEGRDEIELGVTKAREMLKPSSVNSGKATAD